MNEFKEMQNINQNVPVDTKVKRKELNENNTFKKKENVNKEKIESFNTTKFLYFKTSKTIHQKSIYIRISIIEVWLSILSLILSIIVERLSYSSTLKDSIIRIMAFLSSLLCLFSVPMTHGILGKVLYNHQWHFWQPFKGGRRFIVLQTFSWFFFALALICSGFFGYLNIYASDIMVSNNNNNNLIKSCDNYFKNEKDFKETEELLEIPGLWMGNGMMGALSLLTMIISLMLFDPYNNNDDQNKNNNNNNNNNNSTKITCSISSYFSPFKTLFKGNSVKRQQSYSTKISSEQFNFSNDENNNNNNNNNESNFNICPSTIVNKTTDNNPIETDQFKSTGKIVQRTRKSYNENTRFFSKTIKKRKQFSSLKYYIDIIIEYLGQLMLDIRMYLVVGIIYNLSTLLMLFIILPFVFLDISNAILFLSTAFLLYLPTYMNDPASNGRREWKFFRSMHFLDDILRYFEGQIIRDFDVSEIRSDGQYIFAMAPHGVYPITVFWSHHTSLWQAAFPQLDGHRISILGANVFHFVPILRDVALWLGSRNVSRRTFDRTLKEGRSVFMVPGGVSEMKYSRSHHQEIVLLSRHKGFVRQAVKHGVNLVPVFSFGETRVLDTLNIPIIHQWLLKRFHSPIPYFRGRFGLQFPRKEKLSIACAKPIQVPQIAEDDDRFEETVNEIHKEFYKRLENVFEKYKSQCGHEQCTLIFK